MVRSAEEYNPTSCGGGFSWDVFPVVAAPRTEPVSVSVCISIDRHAG